MKKHKIEKALPFDSNQLWGDRDYSVQNMLMRQVNFPAFFYKEKGDIFHRIWSDQCRTVWSTASDYMIERYPNVNFLGWMRNSTSDDFLAFGQFFANEYLPSGENKLTGICLVRYTNTMTLYATYAIDLFVKNNKSPAMPLYSDDFAPNVEHDDLPFADDEEGLMIEHMGELQFVRRRKY